MQRTLEDIAADPRVRALLRPADRGVKPRATRPEDPR
jgi:hypothetical protein